MMSCSKAGLSRQYDHNMLPRGSAWSCSVRTANASVAYLLKLMRTDEYGVSGHLRSSKGTKFTCPGFSCCTMFSTSPLKARAAVPRTVLPIRGGSIASNFRCDAVWSGTGAQWKASCRCDLGSAPLRREAGRAVPLLACTLRSRSQPGQISSAGCEHPCP